MRLPPTARLAAVLVASLFAAAPAAAQDGGGGSPPVRMSLVETVRRALADTRESRLAVRDVGIAREGYDRAYGRWLPRVDANAAWTAFSDPAAVFIQGREVQTADRSLFQGQVTAEQTIWDFGKTSSGTAGASARVSGAENRSGGTRERLALEAVSAFLSARRADALRTVAAESLETSRAHGGEAVTLYEGGVVARNDVLAADVQTANAEASLIAAENRVEIARSRLALAIGLPGSAAVVPEEGDFPAPSGPVPALEESLAAARERRPEVLAQEAAVRERQAQATAATAEFAPVLFARGAYAYDSNSFNPNTNLFSVAVGGRVNLFSGLSDEAARRQARLSVDREKDSLALIRDRIALDVKSAHLAVGEAEKRKAVAGVAVARAEENLRIVDDRYREGLAISTEVLDAQTLLTRAKVDLRNASYDLFESRYRLLYERGELLRFLDPHLGAPVAAAPVPPPGPAVPAPAGAASPAEGGAATPPR